jgi:cobalt/nickel transport system permease protein
LHFDLTDHYHHRPSFIHRLDPRVKVLAALSGILAVSLTPAGSWAAFAASFVLALALAWGARVGLVFAIRRSYIALPFVLAALPIPFITPGPTLFELPLLGWPVSVPGAIRFVSILLRTWLAVQFAILLTAVTRFPDLLWALSKLKVPRILVAMIGFLYRYLFVLADEALRMLRARAARSPRTPGAKRPSIGWQSRVAGGMVGSLFLRALERSERVYAAMVSRGYDGQVRSVTDFRMVRLDWVALSTVLMALLVVLGLAMVG